MANELTVKLTEVHTRLNILLSEKATAIPKDFNKTRFLQNCMTVLQDTKRIDPAKLAKADTNNIARTMLKGAFLGLDFFNNECYIILYGTEFNFQTDYKGEVKLCRKYSTRKIKDIYAKLVRTGDDFKEEIKDGKQTISFIPKSFEDGEIIGAFAVVLYEDGGMSYETMSVNDIEGVRKNYSKFPESKMWKLSIGEAYKKTVLRRLCKGISLDFEFAEQDKSFEEGGDLDKDKEIKANYTEVVDPFTKAESKPEPETFQNLGGMDAQANKEKK